MDEGKETMKNVKARRGGDRGFLWQRGLRDQKVRSIKKEISKSERNVRQEKKNC